MKLRYSLLILAALVGQFSMAQQDVKIVKSEFRTDKPGFDAAWKSAGRGDKLYADGIKNYPEAIMEYSSAHAYNPDNPELNYKLGVCYLFTSGRDKSLEYFLKAIELRPDVASDILILAGRAYQYNGNFIEAVSKYTEYLELEDKKDPRLVALVQRYIDEGNAGMQVSGDTARIEVLNAGESVNSPFDDYSPVLSGDGLKLYFASRRPLDGKQSGSYDDGLPDENILFSGFSDQKWLFALPLEGKINTAFCEAPLVLSPEGTRMYLYAGYTGEGDIMTSDLKKGVWQKPKPETSGINSLYAETSVAISPKGDEMVFVSSRNRSSAGGKDIYLIRKVTEKRWGKPVNLAVLNSPMDEEAVRYSKGGDTLWFSSRGHGSMGGFDIFYSVRQEDGNWGAPANAGIPFNSVYDDLYFIPAPHSDSLFFMVSNRSGGFGGMDIYTARILPSEPEPEPEPEPVQEVVVPEPQKIVDTVFVVREVVKEVPPVVADPEFFIEGRILDSADETPVVARIDIIDPESYQVVASLISAESDGGFRVNVKKPKNYMMEISSNGYLSDMRRVEIPAGYEGKTYFSNFYLNKITVGKRVVLNNIFFETGKAVLTPASFAELDKLTGIMNDNATMKIEISGHTDNTGSETVNLRLSLERANAVASYLFSKGIDRIRIETRGIGPAQPIESNETAAGRAANRRVEFKILEF